MQRALPVLVVLATSWSAIAGLHCESRALAGIGVETASDGHHHAGSTTGDGGERESDPGPNVRHEGSRHEGGASCPVVIGCSSAMIEALPPVWGPRPPVPAANARVTSLALTSMFRAADPPPPRPLV